MIEQLVLVCCLDRHPENIAHCSPENLLPTYVYECKVGIREGIGECWLASNRLRLDPLYVGPQLERR